MCGPTDIAFSSQAATIVIAAPACGAFHADRTTEVVPASAAMVSANTRVAWARCLASAYSAGLWLMPRSQGAKIMAVGQTPAMNSAS
jgi:hypothetical protein